MLKDTVIGFERVVLLPVVDKSDVHKVNSSKFISLYT